MYLARQRIKNTMHYFIRESFSDGETIKSRNLVDLGRDPRAYIVYPDNGNAFYFDESLCDALEQKGVYPDNEVLEKVLWPFLDPETRRVIEKFTRPAPGRRESIREQKKRCETEPFHLFDMRRMHYLRFGELDQSRIASVPKKIYRKLLDKSRDEIEQQFMEMEQVLKKHEKKNYAFVIFNVPAHFSSPISRKFPQALPRDKVDAYFLEELCRVNADAAFWSDLEMSDTLHPYLIRYVCWFFDSEFEGSHYMEDLMWQFKRRHHGFQPSPSPRRNMSADEAARELDIDKNQIGTLTVKTLSRQYRKMAKHHHPDHGGGHERFIRLNRAFEDLLRHVKKGG